MVAFTVVGALALCAVLIAVAALLTTGDDDPDDADRDTGAGTTAAATTAAPSPTQAANAAANATDATPTAAQTPAAEPTEPAAATAMPAPPTATLAPPPAPTATASAVATATPPVPTPEAVGQGRSQPLPLGQTGITADGAWEVQVIEMLRGDAAWDRILAANQFNSPPLPGMEHVLAQVRVKYLGTTSEAQSVGTGWFNATGDARVRWSWASVVQPEPALDADLFSGGEITGWTVVQARQDETNLILIFEPLISTVEGDELFLALQDGAAVAPATARLAEPNELGFDRQDPVALGERVVGDIWEIWVIESVRGDAALQLLKEANQFNEDPAPGMEYVLVHVGARNVSTEAGSQQMEQYAFSLTGDQNRVYDLPSLVEPEPWLSFDVYAGGEVRGWVALECAAGETNLRLIYEPLFSFNADPRFFALE